MKISIGQSDLIVYITRQLNGIFPDNKEIKPQEFKNHFNQAIERTEYCFSKVNNRYFRDQTGAVLFNHLNADQYSMFLYILSNSIYRNNGDISICTKIFQLNRMLHGIDAFYEVQLPDIFLFVHPLGTVLGRGSYSDYLLVYQRCNIGSNKNTYPVLGKYVSLHPGSSILGNCIVGDNCKIGADSLLLDNNLPDNCLYIGNPKQYTIKSLDVMPEIWI